MKNEILNIFVPNVLYRENTVLCVRGSKSLSLYVGVFPRRTTSRGNVFATTFGTYLKKKELASFLISLKQK